jgi:tRNA dimethylallyltransferase
MQKLLVLVGPTAVGKTALAIKLAQQLSAQIISGDSMQIYREVAVGTAKPTAAERRAVKHYLVDQQSVFQDYSVKMFVDQAKTAVKEIAAQDKLPFLVGGTGFYVNSLLNRLQLGENNTQASRFDPAWVEFLAQQGPKSLWQQLSHRDAAAAQKIPYQNSRRVLRALTVIKRTGQPFSQQQKQIEPRYNSLVLGLNTDRKLLYQRINQRVDLMMKQGLLKEAEFIYQNRAQERQVLQAIGYKEFFPYFAGEADLDSCVAKLKQASRHYAKRQLTYFRHQLSVHWFDPLRTDDYFEEMMKLIKEWLYE